MTTLLQRKCKATNPEDFLNLEIVEEALKVNQSVRVLLIMKKLKDSKASRKDFVNSIYGV